MMRWWLDRGVDGFRMDVINMISKDPAAAGRHDVRRRRPTATGRRTTSAARGSTSSSPRCTARCSPAATDALLTVGEMPGVTVEDACCSPTRPAPRWTWCSSSSTSASTRARSKWDVRPLRLRDLKASLGRWQAGLADVGWNSLYWNNHDQPRVVSRFGDDGAVPACESAKMLATVLHLHRGTPYVYQGEELGMTNAPFATIDDFRDIESLNHYAVATAARRATRGGAGRRCGTMSRDNARTPVQWDASPHAGFTTGTPWIAGQPELRRDQRRAPRSPTRTRCSTTTGG